MGEGLARGYSGRWELWEEEAIWELSGDLTETEDVGDIFEEVEAVP